jgi:Cof subfamily protein (haloacid dehalogenase superfamily)
MVRLIAIDMDGTLLGSNGRVSERNLAALRLAHEQGVEVVIATGRRHSYAMGPLRGAGLCAANALISSNGTVIRSVGAELVHRSHMPIETARWLCEHARAFRSTMVMTFDAVDEDGEERQGALVCEADHELDANINRWMQANARYLLHVERLEDALESDAPIQMMLCGTVERMREAEAALTAYPQVAAPGAEATAETRITLHRTEYPEQDLSILDILPAGISKASALEKVAALRGLKSDEIMAIGDNWNDVPMLEFAGHPVVMDNAPEELRDRAAAEGWEVAPSNDEDGVAVVIEAALGVQVGVVG